MSMPENEGRCSRPRTFPPGPQVAGPDAADDPPAAGSTGGEPAAAPSAPDAGGVGRAVVGVVSARGHRLPSELSRLWQLYPDPTRRDLDGTDGRRPSRTVYKHTVYVTLGSRRLGRSNWTRLLKVAEEEKANLFFGVCPRFSGKRRFDLAWQVRTVRAAVGRPGLLLGGGGSRAVPPERTAALVGALVRSGNGVHLYWFLAEPYQIDDVGDPPPVFTEFIDSGTGKKKPRRYLIVPDDQKVY